MTTPEDTEGGIDIAFWLTRSVGRTLGLNFSRAIEDGRLDPSDFADLITTCRNCPHAAPCQQWLGRSGGPRGATRAPEFCPNGDALHALKPH